MTILITGILGNIGSYLGYYLYKKGHKIIGIDNFENGYQENLKINDEEYCEFHDISVSDYDKLCWVLNNYKIDAIVHLAAISSLPKCEKDPVECFYQNVLGTSKVLEAARVYGIKNIIFASSSSVYEKNHESVLSEDLIVEPILAYPLSKKLAEDICLSYIEKYEMNIAILRFFNVFGPRNMYRQSPPLINYIVRERLKGNPPTFHSDGEQRRDYISISKVCEAIEGCLNKTACGIFNIASGQTVSVNEIYTAICKELAFNTPANYHNAEDLWKDYGLSLKKGLVAKEVNKYARGSNQKFYNQLGIGLKENTLEEIAKTAREIATLYATRI